ncbi:MAG: hypothetical protein KDK97_03795 [Verrucomicrobiales bacterium]|nr:hypothetical protein [Verrucomicrobiales bacterium]MCP5556418.1 hypothetical protein [Verrucomicrobiaceae bacterium]
MSATTTPVTTPQHDTFADWLSPILVKELRQGLQTYVFAIIFMGIQATMILTFGLQALISDGTGQELRDVDWFFWAMIWGPAIIIMPLRGMSAVTTEHKAQTLELMQMTHMSSFRIILGKWVGIVVQTLLLLISLLPYAILRYFFGGVNLTEDLGSISFIMLASMTLTAITIAASTLPGIFRGLVSIVVVWTMIGVATSRVFGGGSWGPFGVRTSLDSWQTILSLILLGGSYIVFCLELAASRIAPEAENHALRKRLIAFAVLLGSLGVIAIVKINSWGSHIGASAMAFGFPILLWTVVDALTELPNPNPHTYSAIAKKPWIVRRLGMALHPGWPSGLLFFIVVWGLYFMGLVIVDRGPSGARDQVLIIPMLVAGWIFTPLLPLLWLKNLKQRMVGFVGIQLLCWLIYIVAQNIVYRNGTGGREMSAAIGAIPSCSLYYLMDHGMTDHLTKSLVPIASLTTGGILLVLIFYAFREFRLMLRVERVARTGDSI